MFNEKFGLETAVLNGTKTMTRRMVNVPEYWHGMWVWGFAFDKQSHSLRLYDADEGSMEDPDTGECAYIKPRYNVGEVVAVAQSYKSIFEESLNYALPRYHWLDDHIDEKGYTNKMFVKASEMPHQIRITDIKVERLQDISDEDCLREGVLERVIRPFKTLETKYQAPKTPIYKDTPREAFAALIDKVSGKGTWKRNPWVWVYSFEKIK